MTRPDGAVRRVFLLPDLGEGLADAEIVCWLVEPGMRIEVDQPVAEVETAKAVIEVPSPYAGIVLAVHGSQGQVIAVGAPLMTVAGAAGSESGCSGAVLVGSGARPAATGSRRRRVLTGDVADTGPGEVAREPSDTTRDARRALSGRAAGPARIEQAHFCGARSTLDGIPAHGRDMKGIILAGGSGTRLSPITRAVSKQLLAVYDKPMAYYPLSVLMLAGIREILLISTPADLPHFRRLFSSGAEWGLEIDYAEQAEPLGLPEAFLIGADHVGTHSVALVLGDNVFHGPRFSELLRSAKAGVTDGIDGCVVFGYAVRDPGRYGVAESDECGRLVSIEEKPEYPRSNRAVTGLYLCDNRVVEIARKLRPSGRGELEITDVVRAYMALDAARLVDLGRGFAWLDTGTHESLLDAGEYVRVLENRQGIRIACLEEIAMRMGYIDATACYALGEQQASSGYGTYVMDVAKSYSGSS